MSDIPPLNEHGTPLAHIEAARQDALANAAQLRDAPSELSGRDAEVARIRQNAAEVHGILRASGVFDQASRIFPLLNSLESTAVSYCVETYDLRAACGGGGV